MLNIDSKIEQDLRNVLLIAERMSKFENNNEQNYQLFDQETNCCKLRDDNEILTIDSSQTDESRRSQLLINAKLTYDDYLITPPSKFVES